MARMRRQKEEDNLMILAVFDEFVRKMRAELVTN
jgi:hypothetical protein